MKKIKLVMVLMVSMFVLASCGESPDSSNKKKGDNIVGSQNKDETKELQPEKAKKLCEDALSVLETYSSNMLEYRNAEDEDEEVDIDKTIKAIDEFYTKYSNVLSTVDAQKYYMNMIYEQILESNDYNAEGLSFDMISNIQSNDEVLDMENEFESDFQFIKKVCEEGISEEEISEESVIQKMKSSGWDNNKMAFTLLTTHYSSVPYWGEISVVSAENVREIGIDSYKDILNAKSINADDVKKIALADVTFKVEDIEKKYTVPFANVNNQWKILYDQKIYDVAKICMRRTTDSKNIEMIEDMVEMSIRHEGKCTPGVIYLFEENDKLMIKGNTGIESELENYAGTKYIKSKVYEDRNATKVTIVEDGGEYKVSAEYIADSEIQ